MFKNIKLVLTIFVFVILSFTFTKHTSASQTYFGSFDNLNNWEVIPANQLNTWSVNDGWLQGDISRKGSSYIILSDIVLDKDFDITYDGINLVGIDQEFVFGYNSVNSHYLVNTRFYQSGWPDSANEVVLWKCTSTCSELKRNKSLGFYLEKNKKYSFRISLTDGVLNFYIDGVNVLSFSDLSLKDVSGRVGFWSWGGDYSAGNLNKYDNFSINSDIPLPSGTPTVVPTSVLTNTPIPTSTSTPTPTPTIIPTPTATPTPTPVVKGKKIFILPGLGASWNSEAMVYGKQVGEGDWKMTPFVNNYDGVTELLKNNGLEEDKDFFVWNYDWRKSMAEIESKFNDFVNSKNLTEDDDIYLIGHSLGGVVARLWTQTNLNNSNIKEVITLGSPHKGSVDSYSVWNGGEILKMNGLSSVAFQILLGLQNKGFVITDINKIRSFAPVLKDLLPTFDYVLKSGKKISWNNLESKNDYLNNKNQSVSNLSSKLNLSVGTGFSTPNALKLGSRSVFDKTLGLWPDGELLSYTTSDGDGTVLKTSANLNQSNFYEVNSDHGEITNKSINLIADKIGLSNKSISFNYVDNFSDSLVIFIGSPVTSSLKCGSDIFEEKDGFIVAKNKNYQDCELTLSPTDNGVVHLVLGNTKNNEWNYLEKNVVLNTPEKIKMDFSKAEILTNKDNKQFLMNSIRVDLEKLKLTKAIKSFDKGELTKVALYVFEYRAKNSEREISQRILDNLFYLAAIVGPDKNKESYKTLSGYVDLIESTLNFKAKRKTISKNSVFSLIQLQNLEKKVKEMVKKKSYPSYSMVLVLSGGYGAETLK